MENQDLYTQCMNTVDEVAENVMPDNSNTDLQFKQTFNVKMPKPGKKILIDACSIEKIKNECTSVKKTTFPIAELLLGLATLFLGAFLSAVMSQIEYKFAFLSILFYSICPVVGIGTFVAYFFCRKNEGDNIKTFAEKIEDCLQNIDDDSNGGIE